PPRPQAADSQTLPSQALPSPTLPSIPPPSFSSPPFPVMPDRPLVDPLAPVLQSPPPSAPPRSAPSQSASPHATASPSPPPSLAPADRLLINCPWMSSKVSAPLIQALQSILDQSQRPLLLRFFSSGLLRRNNDFLPFERDLQAALGVDRVVLMPYARPSDYLAQLKHGDLSLDSFPFGGSNVVADSLGLAQPIVVLEGDRWYNRIGPQLLRRAGLEELITQEPRQYCEKVLELIHNDDYRSQLHHHLRSLDLAATVFKPEGIDAFKPLVDKLLGDRSDNHRNT
ncbi:MAG: hypothetical protein ACO4CG_11580, partial [Prochlorothrix sp.]